MDGTPDFLPKNASDQYTQEEGTRNLIMTVETSKTQLGVYDNTCLAAVSAVFRRKAQLQHTCYQQLIPFYTDS